MIRVGQGIDVHAFDESRPLILGGVRISDTGGLAGHSDADAVLHAITDALLGAAGAGDIGQYFPSDDRALEGRRLGASSSREAKRIVDEMDAEIANIDITIIAEKPKLAPFREAMQREDRAAARPPGRPRQRQGDDDRSPRLHRPRRGDLRDGDRLHLHHLSKSMPTVKKTPRNIDEYISGFPPDVQEILETIRSTIRSAAAMRRRRSAIGSRHSCKTVCPRTARVNKKSHRPVSPPVKGDAALIRRCRAYAGEKGNLRFPSHRPIPYALIREVSPHAPRRGFRSQIGDLSNYYSMCSLIAVLFVACVQRGVGARPARSGIGPRCPR